MDDITDPHGNVLARVEVIQYDHYKFKGRLIFSAFPPALERLLKEFEDSINAVALSSLDGIQERMQDFELFFEPTGQRIHDLQVFEGEWISFQVER